MSLALRRRHSFLELNRRARFDHITVVGPERFGNVMGINVKVGLAADLVTLNTKSTLVLVVNQYVSKFEILDEDDGRGVIQNILQAPFAGAKRVALVWKICAHLFHSWHLANVGVRPVLPSPSIYAGATPSATSSTCSQELPESSRGAGTQPEREDGAIL